MPNWWEIGGAVIGGTIGGVVGGPSGVVGGVKLGGGVGGAIGGIGGSGGGTSSGGGRGKRKPFVGSTGYCKNPKNFYKKDCDEYRGSGGTMTGASGTLGTGKSGSGSSTSKSCFIATEVYGCKPPVKFYNFRDTLKPFLVKWYYKISPSIVKLIRFTKTQKSIKWLLEKIIRD